MKRLWPSRWRVFDRALVVVLTLAFLLFGLAGLYEHRKSDRLARAGAQAQTALCSFRTDLATRIVNSEKFLAEHPGDINLGTVRISRAQVINQLENQKATLKSLDDLNCRKDTP